MAEFYAHDELATEEGFVAVVRRLPKPIPPELLPIYRRLRSFGLRRGWAWPYRNYVPNEKRATPAAGEPHNTLATPAASALPIDRDTLSVGHWKFTERYEYWIDEQGHVRRALRETLIDRLGQRWPADWLGPRAEYEEAHALRLATPRPAGQSHGHLLAIAGQEYYTGHLGRICRAPLTSGFDDDGFRLDCVWPDDAELREMGFLPPLE